MKQSIVFFMVAFLNVTYASNTELKKPCEEVRSFDCKFSYELNNGEKASGSAEMSDYKYLFADEYCDVFQSKLVLSSNKLEQVFFTAADDNANDIEEARDDSPNDRGGWGGKEFYISLSESTHAIMTVAKKYQVGNAKREYDLVFFKHVEDSDPEEMGQGTLECQLK